MIKEKLQEDFSLLKTFRRTSIYRRPSKGLWSAGQDVGREKMESLFVMGLDNHPMAILMTLVSPLQFRSRTLSSATAEGHCKLGYGQKSL